MEETSSFKFLISEVDQGVEYPIEETTEGVTIRAEAQRLEGYGFEPSNQQVFSPFDATIQAMFKGVLMAESSIEVAYPETFSLNDDKASCSQQRHDGTEDEDPCEGLPTYSALSCSVTIDGEEYTADECAVDPQSRTVSIESYLGQDLDLTRIGSRDYEGELIACIIKGGLFLNPPSAKPVESAFQIKILDDHGHDVAHFDPAGE